MVSLYIKFELDYILKSDELSKTIIDSDPRFLVLKDYMSAYSFDEIRDNKEYFIDIACVCVCVSYKYLQYL